MSNTTESTYGMRKKTISLKSSLSTRLPLGDCEIAPSTSTLSLFVFRAYRMSHQSQFTHCIRTGLPSPCYLHSCQCRICQGTDQHLQRSQQKAGTPETKRRRCDTNAAEDTKSRAKVQAPYVMVFDISHPIQSLFTSGEGISRHGPRLALHLAARIGFLVDRERVSEEKSKLSSLEHGYHIWSRLMPIK